MKITLHEIAIKALTDGYEDKREHGVRGYGGRLNIRPAYQREFIYKDAQRKEVIYTVRKDFPLNTMYWVVAGDGFELMDGQQRTVSICQYVHGDFSVEIDGTPMFFGNLTKDKKEQILEYKLSVYVCEGEDGEKLDWFRIINIAGMKLTEQEMRNAMFTGPWLSDAKRWFSSENGPAYQISGKYVVGEPARQLVLEKALQWISGGRVVDYMSRHQHDVDAQELWQYFQEVISWIERVFPKYRTPMKGLDWGRFYGNHKDDKLNAATLEQRIEVLVRDKDVTNIKGIYEYLLTNDEKHLNLRAFDEETKLRRFELQGGVCPICNLTFSLKEMEADHIVPWNKGGKTEFDNCQMLCRMDNRTKGGR